MDVVGAVLVFIILFGLFIFAYARKIEKEESRARNEREALEGRIRKAQQRQVLREGIARAKQQNEAAKHQEQKELEDALYQFFRNNLEGSEQERGFFRNLRDFVDRHCVGKTEAWRLDVMSYCMFKLQLFLLSIMIANETDEQEVVERMRRYQWLFSSVCLARENETTIRDENKFDVLTHFADGRHEAYQAIYSYHSEGSLAQFRMSFITECLQYFLYHGYAAQCPYDAERYLPIKDYPEEFYKSSATYCAKLEIEFMEFIGENAELLVGDFDIEDFLSSQSECVDNEDDESRDEEYDDNEENEDGSEQEKLFFRNLRGFVDRHCVGKTVTWRLDVMSYCMFKLQMLLLSVMVAKDIERDEIFECRHKHQRLFSTICLARENEKTIRDEAKFDVLTHFAEERHKAYNAICIHHGNRALEYFKMSFVTECLQYYLYHGDAAKCPYDEKTHLPIKDYPEEFYKSTAAYCAKLEIDFMEFIGENAKLLVGDFDIENLLSSQSECVDNEDDGLYDEEYDDDVEYETDFDAQ